MPKRSESGDQNAQWLAQAGQLNLRLKMAYRDRDNAYQTMRSELHDKDAMNELDAEERMRTRHRAEEGDLLMKQLQKVKNNVAELRQLIESRGTGTEYVDKLRKAMDVTENEVYVARESQRERLDILCAEERTISRELAEMEKVFESWTTGEHSRPLSSNAARSHRHDGDADVEEQESHFQTGSKIETSFLPTELPAEVLAVEKLLREEGGTTGGWDERDHERFLRYRTQHKGQPHIYIQKTASDLPAHDEESVEAHERWYVRYQSLLQAKKNAIRAWRTTKERPRTAASSDRPSPAAAEPRPASAFGNRSAASPGDASAAAGREEQREAVRKWREEKERERQEHAVAAAAAERSRVQEQRRREAAEREREKERLLRYKQSKAMEAELRRLEEEREREAGRPSLSPEQLQRIRDKNEALARERTLALRRKQEEQARQAERDSILAAAAAEVAPPSPPRDPHRIVAPTAASQARRERVMKELAGEREGAAAGYFAIMRPAAVLHVPQRATPSWRAGL